MTVRQTFRNTVTVILTLAAAYVLYLGARILVVLVVAIIVASAIRPAVLRLQKWRFPEGIAILIVYLFIGILLFLLGAGVLPPVVNQFTGYLNNEQGLASRIIVAQGWLEQQLGNATGHEVSLFNEDTIRNAVSNTVDKIVASIPSAAGEAGAFVGDFILMAVMGAYWLTSRDQAVEYVQQLFPIGQRPQAATIIEEIESSLGAYVRGVVLVATFVGVANFVILVLLGVPNAATLGFIVGITTALPIVGGYIGAFTATLLALLSSPLYALGAFVTFVLVQQIETHYLTPRVMSQSVGLNPILIIVVLFIGFAVDGVIGALISVPLSGIVSILLRHLVIEPRMQEASPQIQDGGVLLVTKDEAEATEAEARPG